MNGLHFDSAFTFIKREVPIKALRSFDRALFMIYKNDRLRKRFTHETIRVFAPELDTDTIDYILQYLSRQEFVVPFYAVECEVCGEEIIRASFDEINDIDMKNLKYTCKWCGHTNEIHDHSFTMSFSITNMLGVEE